MDYLEALQEIAEEYGDGVLTDSNGKSYRVSEAIEAGQSFNRYMSMAGYHFGTGEHVVDWDGQSAHITRLTKSGEIDIEVARVDY